MRTIYHVFVEVFGEQDFFFDEDFRLLHYWDRNDAQYRGEYMKQLFEKLGFNVKKLPYTDDRLYGVIYAELKSIGASEDDFND